VSASGDEVSWLAATLGEWLRGLTRRDEQFRQWLEAKGKPPKVHNFVAFFNPAGFLTAVKRQVAAGRWALDDVVHRVEVTDLERVDQVKAPPTEGVLVHGLSLVGAHWDPRSGTLAESKPKSLFCPMPILYVTALPAAAALPPTAAAAAADGGASISGPPQQRRHADQQPGQQRPSSLAQAAAGSDRHDSGDDLGPYGGYECPVYRYRERTDRYYVFSVPLATTLPPRHWTLRGVALVLCDPTAAS